MLTQSPFVRQYRRYVVAWAFGVINRSSFVLSVEPVAGSFGWDIETPHGWVAINSIEELCIFARQLSHH